MKYYIYAPDKKYIFDTKAGFLAKLSDMIDKGIDNGATIFSVDIYSDEEDE